MWAVAIYDLKLSPVQFFALTPRQFDALLKRKERETQDTEYLFAQLTAYTVNFSMCHPKEPVAPKDFMPSEWAKPQPMQKRVRITKKVRNNVTQSFRAMAAAVRQGNKRNANAFIVVKASGTQGTPNA